MLIRRLWCGLVPGIAGLLLAGVALAGHPEAPEENFSRRAARARPTRANLPRPGILKQDGQSRMPLRSHDAAIKTAAKRNIASFLPPSVREKKTVILPGSSAGLRVRSQ